MTVILHPNTDFDQITVKHPAGFEVILVRIGDDIRGWRNSCPHVGVGLDWGDGRCLVGPNELQCALHGARFRADSGFCFDGPCAGDALAPVAVRIESGRVVAA